MISTLEKFIIAADMTKLTHAQLDELMRLGHGRQLAGTPRSRVQSKLGKMGLAKLIEGHVADFWEITDAGKTALLEAEKEKT